MDAKERLRRYLEQRRELGESELVLDAMPVDDLMAMIGVRSTTPTKTARAESSSAADVPPPAPRPAQRSDGGDIDASELTPQPSAPVVPPPVPEVRFDESASTNWRDVLRTAGAAGEGVRGNSAVPPTAPRVAEPAPAAASASPASASASESPASSASAASAPIAASVAVLPSWLAALDLPAGLSVGAASRAMDAKTTSLATLDDVANAARACTACALHASATNVVPGEGNPDADFLCVGEAPGANEDIQGRPFVGEAGQLLTKILGAIQLQREDVYICNVLKHRPPGNRDPLPEEVVACQPFLMRQLELVAPRVILALGRFAAQTLLQTTTPIGKLRGQIHLFHGIPLIVTYHPAALLRNESWKRPTWEDVKLARRILDAARSAPSV